MSLTRDNSNVSAKRIFKCLLQERIQKFRQERIQMSLTCELPNVFDKSVSNYFLHFESRDVNVSKCLGQGERVSKLCRLA